MVRAGAASDTASATSWIPKPAQCVTRGGEQCVADEVSGALAAVGAVGRLAPWRSAPGYTGRPYRAAAHLCCHSAGTAPSQQAGPVPVLRLVTMDVAILALAAAMHRVPRSGIRPAPRLGRGVVAIARQHGQEVQRGGRAGLAETTSAGLNENSAFCRLGVRYVPDTQPRQLVVDSPPRRKEELNCPGRDREAACAGRSYSACRSARSVAS